MTIKSSTGRKALLKHAYTLALITVLYNIIEGLASVGLGLEDETFALMGFGLDSFVEVISGIGIWHMLWRMKRSGAEDHDRFERTALRITGWAFYALSLGLSVTGVYGLISGHAPATTLWGIVISLISIFTMWALIHFKLKAGRALNSQAIIADAYCTRACMYLSVVLLASSAGYALTGVGRLDAIGALLIAGLSFKEGREALGKAEGKQCSCAGACAPKT